MPAGCWLGLANTQAGSRDCDPVHNTHVWTLSVSSLLNNGTPDNSCHSKCDATLISVFRSESSWERESTCLHLNTLFVFSCVCRWSRVARRTVWSSRCRWGMRSSSLMRWSWLDTDRRPSLWSKDHTEVCSSPSAGTNRTCVCASDCNSNWVKTCHQSHQFFPYYLKIRLK